MTLWQDNRAIAFGFVTFAAFFIFFSSLYILLAPLDDSLVTHMNRYIGDSEVSQQAADTFEFQITLRNAMPLFGLLGSGAWLLIRALEKKNEDNGSSW